MKYFLKKLLVMLPAITLLCFAGGASAVQLLNNSVIDDIDNQTQDVSNVTFDPGTDEYTLSEMVADILNVFFGLLGTICVYLLVLSGYNWMTAAGDSAKSAKAMSTIKTAIIGLIIITAAYAITYWIFVRLPGSSQ